MSEEVYTASESPIVCTAWLNDRLGAEDMVLADVRPPFFFGQAHLPGAINLPVFYLHGPDGPPDEAELIERLGAMGVASDSHVIAYDEGGSPSAAVLYGALRHLGHRRVAVLDGGITRWRHEGRDWEYSARAPEPSRYEPRRPGAGVYARREDVLDALKREDTIAVDVRSPAEFLGLQITARRNGHIPGAINVEWSNALRSDSDGLPVLRSDDDIRDLLRAAGVTPDKDVIVYCQSGSRSAHTFLVLEALDFHRVRNYVAGWQEWGDRADTPIEAE